MTEASDVSVRANRHLPTDVSQVMIVARYDILKHIRSKRIYGIIAILALILVVNMVLPPALGNSYSKDAGEFASGFISFMPTVIIIIATLFAGDAIVSEFQGRTGYLLFPNPVKRSSLYAGKYLAAFGLGLSLLVLYYGVVAILALAVTGSVSELMVWSFLLAVLFTASTISMGFMISSLMKGSTGALILTFALLLMIMPMISGIMSLTDVKPDFLLSFAGDSIGNMMQTPYPQDSKMTFDANGQVMTIWNYYAQPWIATAVMLVYGAVTFVLGFLAFRKREMVS